MSRTPKNSQKQDFVVLSTDAIRGEDSATGSGSDLALQGGSSSGGGGDGANVTIDGGDPDTAGKGGDVLISGRAGDAAGDGGSIFVNAAASPSGNPGDVVILASGSSALVTPIGATIQAVAGTTATVNGANLILRQGGAGSFFGSGGYGASLIGGSAIGASGAAGDDVQIQGGAGDLAGDGGWSVVQGGNSGASGTAGSVYIAAGSNATTLDADDQGSVFVLAGNATPPASKPGIFLFAGNDAVFGTGAALSIGGPDASGTSAGSLLLEGGGGLAANAGGNVSFAGGAAAGAGDGGSVVLGGAASASGDDGTVRISGVNQSLHGGTSGRRFQILGGVQDASGIVDTDGPSVFLKAQGDANRNGAELNIGHSVGAGSASFTARGGSGISGNITGGNSALVAGSGFGTGDGGQISVAAGQGGDGGGGHGGIAYISGGQPGAGNANGGGIALTSRAGNGTGIPGDITMNTNGGDRSLSTSGGVVKTRTTTGFSGSEKDTLTFGSQTVTGVGNSILMVVVGTLDTNGQNLKITVDASAVNNIDDTDVASGYIVQTFYRAAGTVNAMTAHVDDQQFVGTWPSTTTPSFSLVINGDDIELHFAWTGVLAGAITVNTAAHWNRQEGGFIS
jgi:hypothetical protein